MSFDVLPAVNATAAVDSRRGVRRSHGLRMLGLALGTLMVGAVLYQHGVPTSVWVLLVLHGLVWPHVAWLILRRVAEPVALDQRFFMGDAAMGGVWIALMQFNLLPSVLLATMFAITLIAIGGQPFLARGMAMQALACCVAAVANGLAFAPATNVIEVLASLPLLVVFPMTLGTITRDLAQRVRAQNIELRRMSSIDSLSGLLNRSHWEDAVNAALDRNCCDDAVMLLIDIDQFKRVNDQHGHTAGDDVVRKVGAIIRRCLRKGDLAGRYGGDEFGVVLCGVDMPTAETVAERIRSSVACSLFERAPGLRCTLSIGLARNRAAARVASEWVKDADAALYRAKLAGRNRLVIAN
ncbi:MAG TPA: diguanylate cyclase [Rhodanobacteraceae bacterium]|nr:diguanylate cyclase [Rhodanobacteraceae bacterium]